jgi:hypothetical protein
MKIRTTEKPHCFADQLCKTVPIYGLQGLTLGSQKEFTAGIEAVEYDAHEKVDAASIFPMMKWKAKWSLCDNLSVPLYALTYKPPHDFIEIFKVIFDSGGLQSLYKGKFIFDEFAKWWASIKGTVQDKKLYEAKGRLSFFDNLLDRYGLAWGGNVDGFLLDLKMKISAIIEFRFPSKSALENYDPADYFNYRNGDYYMWEPLVLLSIRLRAPLFLMTFERNSQKDRLGFSVIDSISKAGLSHRGDRPCDNIIQGIGNIMDELERKLSESPARIT